MKKLRALFASFMMLFLVAGLFPAQEAAAATAYIGGCSATPTVSRSGSFLYGSVWANCPSNVYVTMTVCTHQLGGRTLSCRSTQGWGSRGVSTAAACISQYSLNTFYSRVYIKVGGYQTAASSNYVAMSLRC